MLVRLFDSAQDLEVESSRIGKIAIKDPALNHRKILNFFHFANGLFEKKISPLLIVPHRRRELFQVIANAVVPMSAQIALSSIGFPAAPTVSEDSKDHLSCSCTIESWEPCVLSLRRLGQAARGITHTIGVTTDTYWSSFDFGDFCRAALSGQRQARSTLRGHRIILMAVGWTPAQVAEAERMNRKK